MRTLMLVPGYVPRWPIPILTAWRILQVGTEGYMAPEVLMVTRDGYGCACDVYSLGLTLKERYQEEILR